jgi:hypothetical protein
LQEDAVLECDYIFNKLANYKPDYWIQYMN